MTLNWIPTTGNFNEALYNTLLRLEAPNASDRLTGLMVGGNFTIGLGFDLVKGGRTVQDEVFKQMGFKATDVALKVAPALGTLARKEFDFIQQVRNAVSTHQGSADLNVIMANRLAAVQADPTYNAYLGLPARATFSFTSDAEVRLVFDKLWLGTYREIIFSKWPELRTDVVFSSSDQLIALASMTWNGGGGILGDKLRAAIGSGDRTDAWFEIRYNSNGGTSQSPGLAKRRFLESQVFGLYDNPANVTLAESKQVFAMLAKHRTEILAYESKYGVPPDGTIATRNMIAEALLDPNLAAIAQVQTLYAALVPARDAFITWVNTQLPPGETPLVAADWNPAAIAYNSPTLTLPLESVPHSRVTNWPAWPEPQASFARTARG